MTTTTVAPAVPDAELEAWFAEEIEKPCEAIWSVLPCGRAASWLLVITTPCACVKQTHNYACTPCKVRPLETTYRCRFCRTPAEIELIKRVKGGGR